jgi:hypothetical protein
MLNFVKSRGDGPQFEHHEATVILEEGRTERLANLARFHQGHQYEQGFLAYRRAYCAQVIEQLDGLPSATAFAQ